MRTYYYNHHEINREWIATATPWHKQSGWQATLPAFPLRATDGSYRWFLSRALPIRDQEGKIVRWFGTNTDVTEQRQAEERLREDQTIAAREKGLSFRWQRPAQPIWVYGDPVRLTQVFENLVGNAIKFSVEPGDVAVHLEQAAKAIVRVTDSGAGIRPEMLERIFQPFEQEAQPVARTAGGLGLGLALAKGLIDMHGGQIQAKSSGPGTGAEFVVHLPLTKAPKRKRQPAPRTEAPTHRLLLVEDSVDAAAMLRLLLRKRGHQVDVAYNAAAGLDHLHRHAVEG